MSTAELFMWVRLRSDITVVHSTAQNNSDNLATYPPNNHYSTYNVGGKQQHRTNSPISM